MRERTLTLALAVAALAWLLGAGCSDDEPSAAETDEAYIRALCGAIVDFRNDGLSPANQATPFRTRRIDANQHFRDTMAKATPPDDARDWHEDWLAAVDANLAKLRADDPQAAPDPLDVGPDAPFPARLEALFSTLPECVEARQPAPQPSPGASVGNSHANATATEVAPGEFRISFDYVYAVDPPGTRITAIAVNPVASDGRPLPGYTPVASAVARGSGNRDVILRLAPAQVASLAGFAICFTGPDQPDLGCVTVTYRR